MTRTTPAPSKFIVTYRYAHHPGAFEAQCAKVAFRVCPTEVDVYEDAFLAFQLLTNSTADGGYGVPARCIVFHGHSLGSAVATRVAAALTRMKQVSRV